MTICEVLHRLQDEFGRVETITRIVQLGTVGDQAKPPDEDELRERRN